jgi:pimeloyl-ACP methyl ester carboxylesterase
MKLHISLFLFLQVVFLSGAQAKWSHGAVNLSDRRVLVYERYQPKQVGPTLIFLPGIYRGQLQSDPVTKPLMESGIPFVTMHFAEQPDSIVATAKDSEPDFSKVELQTLAQEVSALAKHLNLEFAIPVTLSYSAAVTSHLDRSRFPVVIEVAPISKSTDTLPDSIVGFYELWESWVRSMPFGSAWLLAQKKAQLQTYWSRWSDGYSARLPLLKDPVYRDRASKGYTALTLAADGFDLRKQDFRKGPQRFWILGSEEQASRSDIQNRAIESYQKTTGHEGSVFVIQGAGHVVSSDEPEKFVETLKVILRQL